MLLRRIELQHFRNYASLDATFAPGLVLLEGANAQGKTNLLEAMYLLATTKSVRARSDAELVSWAERDPLSAIAFARIVGHIERDSGPLNLEIVVRDAGADGQTRKRFKVNGVERKAGEALGLVNAVYFAPNDVDLVAGSPSVRRRYLDVMLCQIDAAYVRALNRYNRVVVQRNALLRQIREGAQPLQALEYWDGSLCEFGAQLTAWRAGAVRDLALAAGERHQLLSGGRETLSVEYRPALIEPPPQPELVAGGPLVALEALRRSLAAVRNRELGAGMSLVGPHRDDLAFLVNGVDATAFGSRGQQRTSTLALKLAELGYMASRTGDQPVLLLDDATSELDPLRRAAIIDVASSGQQTFMTSADGASLGAVPTLTQRWDVRGGTISLVGRG